MNATYAPKYRAANFGTVPSGWNLEETGTLNCYPLRRDLPIGTSKFGVISYPAPLTDEQIEQYELQPR